MSLRPSPRRVVPLALALTACVPVVLSAQVLHTLVSADPSCGSTTSPACTSTDGGATASASVTNTGSTMSGSGSITGTTATATDFLKQGVGLAWADDRLSFSGGTPSQIFVDVLQVVAPGPAVAGNSATTAESRALVLIRYGEQAGYTLSYNRSSSAPENTQTLNVSTIGGGLTRYTFAYEGYNDAFFELYTEGRARLSPPLGSTAVLSGSASGFASVGLINVIGVAANGVQLTCTFRSGAPCGVGINAVPGTTVTPEPASIVLLGTGLLGVIGAAHRRRSPSSAS